MALGKAEKYIIEQVKNLVLRYKQEKSLPGLLITFWCQTKKPTNHDVVIETLQKVAWEEIFPKTDKEITSVEVRRSGENCPLIKVQWREKKESDRFGWEIVHYVEKK